MTVKEICWILHYILGWIGLQYLNEMFMKTGRATDRSIPDVIKMFSVQHVLNHLSWSMLTFKQLHMFVINGYYQLPSLVQESLYMHGLLTYLLTPEVSGEFLTYRWPFWMTSSGSTEWHTIVDTWWRHQMETFSASLAPVGRQYCMI